MALRAAPLRTLLGVTGLRPPVRVADVDHPAAAIVATLLDSQIWLRNPGGDTRALLERTAPGAPEAA